MTWIAIWLGLGCAPEPINSAQLGRSGQLVTPDAVDLWTVNRWDGTLVRADTVEETSTEVVVGGEPTQLALVGDELWVTLRADGTVARFDVSGEEPVERARIPVGAEPFGIVSSPGGDRVYVTLSQEAAVLELDGSTAEVLRRFDVDDDPRWLGLHPTGDALFVTYAMRGGASRIDLDTRERSEIEVPDTQGGDDRDPVPLAPRSSGQLDISKRGDWLALPTVYADHLTPGRQPDFDISTILVPPTPYYAPKDGLQRINASVVMVELDPTDGAPTGEPEAILLWPGDTRGPVRGTADAVAFLNDHELWVSMGSANCVIAVDLRRSTDREGSYFVAEREPLPSLPSWWGFTLRAGVPVRTGLGPVSLVPGPEGAIFVYLEGDRSIARIDGERVRWELSRTWEHPTALRLSNLQHERTFSAGSSKLEPDVEAGRELFMSAVDARITSPGAGVACGSCHVDGRTDGLTWAFDDNPRQTPALVAATRTAPVTWTDAVSTVAREAQITAIGRMGGLGLSDEEAQQLATFIGQLRPIVRPVDDPAAVARGEALFEAPEVGCAECHRGEVYTDREANFAFGRRVDTPSLLGVAASPPYLHDGSVPTLRGLLERLRDGGMGSTASLSESELDDLEAYLRSL